MARTNKTAMTNPETTPEATPVTEPETTPEATPVTEPETTPEATPQAATTPQGPQMVTVHLFKDSERYKDDVFVAVNGKTFLIKRGVDVKVPDYVAEVLARQRAQDAATAQMIEQLGTQYVGAAQQHGA